MRALEPIRARWRQSLGSSLPYVASGGGRRRRRPRVADEQAMAGEDGGPHARSLDVGGGTALADYVPAIHLGTQGGC